MGDYNEEADRYANENWLHWYVEGDNGVSKQEAWVYAHNFYLESLSNDVCE